MAFATGSFSKSSEINVTPLIDVLLVLLVIFMVVAPTASRGLDSSVPQGKAEAANGLPPVIVQLIGGESGQAVRYRVGEAETPTKQVEGHMRALLALRQNRTVFVEASHGVSYGQVAGVVADAKSAGATDVVLSRLDAGR